MNAIERALRDFLTARPAHVSTALVGGMAVSTRTEPRFTRDVDLAVAVADDDEATQYIFALRQLGYEIVSTLEQTTQHRLSTTLRKRSSSFIHQRGFARKRDLHAGLAEVRALVDA